MAEFRCYLLDGDRKVMAVESVRSLTLPRAVTKGILAGVMRRATTFELWRNDLCVYVHQTPLVPPPAATSALPVTFRRDAVDG
ncbi:MAG: hypothetical protein ACREEL_06070 [Stellaceae bacterium]